MPLGSKRIWCNDLSFVVWESVYEPAEDTVLFSENIDVDRGMLVLDVGTGCGVLGVLAARKAQLVVAVDINPAAVRCSAENARFHKLDEKILFIQGNLFTAIIERKQFDRIIFNAPYLPTALGESKTWLSRAWDGGITGREIIDNFISSACKYLKDEGKILLMQSTLIDVNKTIEKFADVNMTAEVVAKRNLPFFETLLLLQASKNRP
jgi:release factor glutamine methyltransferase